MTTLHVPPDGWTVDDLPDREDFRYELVDGALLLSPSPTPRHSGVAARLQRALWDALGPGWDVLENGGYREVGRDSGVVEVTEPTSMSIDLDGWFS